MRAQQRSPVPELHFPAHRRRRGRGWLVVAAVLASSALLVAARAQPGSAPLADLSAVDHASDPAAALDGEGRGPRDQPGLEGEAASEATDLPVTATPRLGVVDGLDLLLPADEAIVVGFHEASSAAHAIEPIGQLLSNENTTRFEPVEDHPDGVGFHILSSRGRIAPPTSAVDIVLEDGDAVLAPVTGIVADIRAYHLYGEHLDHRVEIHPDAAPHLRVVLVHVDDLRVREGDRVVAGTTVLASTANRFPFSSQIDRETEPDRWPHVHLEVQDIDARRPGDPPEDQDTSGAS